MRVGGGDPDASVYHYAFWTEMLRRSPVIINTHRGGKFNHMIVVYCIKYIGAEAKLNYIDPFFGTDQEQPMSEITKRMDWLGNAPAEVQMRERVMSW